MADIRRVTVDLVNVAADGSVIDKNSPDTKLSAFKNFNTEYRIIGPSSGPASSPNAVDFPTINEYLAAEVAEGFLLVYMDQYSIVTQMP